MTRYIEWQDSDIPRLEVEEIGLARQHLNLTALHGEREFTRHGAFVDVNGEQAIITRTMNRNRARAIRVRDGRTLWVSPDVVPPPETVQISDMAVGDMDADGHTEVFLATYEGDILLIDARDGSLKWHKRLDYLIVNPHLRFRRITESPGLQVALTVGRDAPRIYGGRINGMRNPSLAVINCEGEIDVFVPEYDDYNSEGHMTWAYDIDGDGLCEICCCGHARIHWFDSDGTHLFALPTPGEDGHPDDLVVCDWDADRPGKEIIYLDGTTGVRIYGADGGLVGAADLSEYSCHLQEILVFPGDNEPQLVAANIRSPDAHLLMLRHDLSVDWALHADPNALGLMALDWTGDGRPEIVAGGHGRQMWNTEGKDECTFSVIAADGAPVYQARWPGRSNCIPLDVRYTDGAPEVLVVVGRKDGPEGRFSLPEGASSELYTIGPERPE